MNTKKFSNAQEKRIAKDLKYANGKTQPGSGAINVTGLKHDVTTSGTGEWDVLVECKTSAVTSGQIGKRSFSIKREWLEDVSHHAFDAGKAMGIVVFSYDNKKDFVALSEKDFKMLHEATIDYEKIANSLAQSEAQERKIIGYLLQQLGSTFILDLEACKNIDNYDFAMKVNTKDNTVILQSRKKV